MSYKAGHPFHINKKAIREGKGNAHTQMRDKLGNPISQPLLRKGWRKEYAARNP